MAQASPYPDGIGPDHLVADISFVRRWLPLGVLGAVLGLSLTGMLGGLPNPVIARSSSAAELAMKAPQVLRNGEFFEIRLTVEARETIARPVVAVSASYFRDLTINSQIPAPSEEGFADGFFTFEFSPLQTGDMLEIKIDGQVNPPLVGVNRGLVELRDDERVLTRLEPALRVLP
jgi:hypothetical protein